MIRMIPLKERQPRHGQLCLVLYGERWLGIGSYTAPYTAFGRDTDEGDVEFYKNATHWLPLSVVQPSGDDAYLDWGKDGVKTSAAELQVSVEEAWHPKTVAVDPGSQLGFTWPDKHISDFRGERRTPPFTDPGELTDEEAFGEEYGS